MKNLFKHPLFIAATVMLLLGVTVAQGAYWFRVGADGLTFKKERSVKLNTEEAKKECTARHDAFSASKEYTFLLVDEITVTRGAFPITHREQVNVDKLFRWSQ
jgi:hypothetical protein